LTIEEEDLNAQRLNRYVQSKMMKFTGSQEGIKKPKQTKLQREVEK
jgi:hypothetical protein